MCWNLIFMLIVGQLQYNVKTGNLDLRETFDGPVVIEKTSSQKYLGFVLSNIVIVIELGHIDTEENSFC